MPKPTPRRMMLRTVVKEKSTQTFGLMYTAKIGVQTDAKISEYDDLELEPLGATMAARDRARRFKGQSCLSARPSRELGPVEREGPTSTPRRRWREAVRWK